MLPGPRSQPFAQSFWLVSLVFSQCKRKKKKKPNDTAAYNLLAAGRLLGNCDGGPSRLVNAFPWAWQGRGSGFLRDTARWERQLFLAGVSRTAGVPIPTHRDLLLPVTGKDGPPRASSCGDEAHLRAQRAHGVMAAPLNHLGKVLLGQGSASAWGDPRVLSHSHPTDMAGYPRRGPCSLHPCPNRSCHPSDGSGWSTLCHGGSFWGRKKKKNPARHIFCLFCNGGGGQGRGEKL